MEKTLQQIRESRALWQTYEDNLEDLSMKLNKMSGQAMSKPLLYQAINYIQRIKLTILFRILL